MNKQDRQACRAKGGLVRIVHIDPRDNVHTPQGEDCTLPEAKRRLSSMLSSMRETMAVFNSKSRRVPV